ncbi:serine hydrolase domain-containing protein [Pilimelia terevasa]|uniref:serine hydrolase domain-containing protein n=1 Tax=Pilimelia terevasa TaxID=53372 RepID=UPI001667CC8C|nr:serine hydrolase domain-containing protein [Pilimelia terevasa]
MRWRRRFGVAGLVLGVVAALGGPAPASASVDRARLRALMGAERDAGMPGLFAEAADGGDRAALAVGVADLARRTPMRPDLRHRVGSITKTFVAVAVLQLVAEGRIGLDTPVGRYLDADVFPPVGPDGLPDSRRERITVRHLLQHTSGLGEYGALLATAAVGDWARRTTFAPAALFGLGLALPVTHAPGARWSYSNTNYIGLGLIVEKVTGRTLEREIQRRIIDRLGLRDTYRPGTETVIRGPHARAYEPDARGVPRDVSRSNVTIAGAAGDLVSTAADLNRFFRALFDGRLLAPAQWTAMRTTVPVPGAPGVAYGLGLMHLRLPCGTAVLDVWGHNGYVIGYATHSYHVAGTDRQLTVGENAPVLTEALARAQANVLYGGLCPTAPTARAGVGGFPALPPTLR